MSALFSVLFISFAIVIQIVSVCILVLMIWHEEELKVFEKKMIKYIKYEIKRRRTERIRRKLGYQN